MLKKLLLLLTLALCITGTALAGISMPGDLTAIEAEAFMGDAALTGLLTLPDDVSSVGDRAFADTGLYALHLPNDCDTVGADVLAGTNAAYIYLNSQTAVFDSAALTDVHYVITSSSNKSAANFGDKLVYIHRVTQSNGLYYRVNDDGVSPLCPVDGTALGDTVTVPMIVGKLPVTTLEELVMPGCEDVKLLVPSTLPIPEGLFAEYYSALSVTSPMTAAPLKAGCTGSFSAAVAGALGEYTCLWQFTIGGETFEITSTSPTVDFTPDQPGELSVSVTVTDAQGYTVSASSTCPVHCAGVTVEAPGTAASILYAGSSYKFTTAADCSCSAHSYVWHIICGETEQTLTTSVPYVSALLSAVGTYTVTVTVTDEDGNTASASRSFDAFCPGITMTNPVASQTPEYGTACTFTVSAKCACSLTFVWSVTNEGVITQENTGNTPSFTFTPPVWGDLIVSVTALDSFGNTLTTSSTFTIENPNGEVVYRALLIGNTYPGTSSELNGCDTDVAALAKVLGSMSGSSYSVTKMLNVTASGMTSAIGSAFSGADGNDVSLFYYSGHGSSSGALVGTGSTQVTPSTLRNTLDQIPGQKIVILDCCYSGAFINKDGSSSPSAFNSAIISAFSWFNKSDTDLAGNGYHVLTACTKEQLSNTLTGDNSHYWGAFTYSLCYGSGYDEWEQVSLGSLPADTNSDGAITLGEARTRIQERIAYLTSMIDIDQSVQYYGDSSFVLWFK